MARDILTGSRIRERRSDLGMRQAELARRAGISASYLNLIEHNRRRIGGKLLLDIAQALGVEPASLSEGVGAALVASLREAAAGFPQSVPELDRIDEFAGRFPGWAGLLSQTYERITTLERTAAELSDRLAHDPHLATSMHEVLTMVTAIRSTASILAETDEIEPEWRNRFHRNLNEDSARLAESSQALVDYFDASVEDSASAMAPPEEVEAFFEAVGYRFPQLEEANVDPAAIVSKANFSSGAARQMAESVLLRMKEDVRAMPLGSFLAAMKETQEDPGALAQEFGVSLAAVFRRLTTISRDAEQTAPGLVICDRSGALLMRRPVQGFSVPRFSAACPKWPLFEALARPLQPVKALVEMTGQDRLQFDCFAISEPTAPPQFGQDTLYHAYMLVRPRAQRGEEAREVGASCRVCPAQNCAGRREPSLLVQGLMATPIVPALS